MPFYEYECAHCKFYTEVMQKISDPPLTKCPSCGKKALKKLVSAPVFRLKGGGWYETDFKSDKENKRNLAGAEKEEATKTEAPKADAKADTAAPAKPAEAKPTSTESKPDKVSARSRSSSSKAPARTAAKRAKAAPARKKKARR
ncbi:MAG TPA: zinc ribbon domain-containing protein [Steroidobacteraceae bacterium]|nr:zinc ribbon domain-containing protein [Steroidobacteraceae bacterium]